MKREAIKVGTRANKAVSVMVDRAETQEDVLTITNGDEEAAVNFAMRGINIRRQDAFLRPAFNEGATPEELQEIADSLDVTEKGKGGRPRKPPTVVFDKGELPETLSRAEVMALLAKKGMTVKEVK